MEAYKSFAQVYDLFMDNVPYRTWSEYLIKTLRTYGIQDGIVLDLGCGTGTITTFLAEAGYDMIGIDSSAEMLEIARERADESEEHRFDILYLLQDMREFELYGTVRAVVCACDALNYILKEDELLTVFKLVHNYLDPEGIFIFDLNTIYKYRELLGEATIAENRDEGSFIWENDYDEEERLNAYELTFFIREENGLYRKYEETHMQRAYEIARVKELLTAAGLETLAVYDEYTGQPVKEDSERICFVAGKKTDRNGEKE